VRSLAQSPGEIAEQAFYQGLYGSHPYASRPGGDEASLLAIERDDVVAFFKRYYVGSNATVAIIGALGRDQAEALAVTLIGGLPAGEPAPALPVVPPLTEAKLIRIAHPSTQSHVYMGQIGIQRGAPDYDSLYLGNHILGGNGLVSLLSNEVREKRGLSYSVYSFFAPMREPGPFAMVLQTRADQADEAVQVVRSTLKDFVADGPDPEQLEAARRNITGGFALRIDSNQKILQYLAVIGFYRLPLDHLQTLIPRFEAVSLEQVKSALHRHLDPDRLVTVIVGG
jgi:zinc protease